MSPTRKKKISSLKSAELAANNDSSVDLKTGAHLPQRPDFLSTDLEQAIAGQMLEEWKIHAQYDAMKGIIESADDSIFSLDTQFRYTSFNKMHVSRMKLLYNADLELGKNMLDFVSVEADREVMRGDINRTLAGEWFVNSSFFGDTSYARRFFEVSHNPIKDQQGDIIGAAIFSRDLTQRRAVEEALDRERRLLRTVIDIVPDQIFAHDADYRFILNNRSDALILGVEDPETLLGKSDFDFYPPELAEKYQADDRQVILSGQPLINHEEANFGAGRAPRWLLTSKVPFRDNQGKVIGLVGIARDITDRKHNEEELYRSRQMLQLVLDTIPQRVFWKDRNLRFLGCNKAFAMDESFADPAEIIGKTDFEISSKQNAALYQADDRFVMENDTPKLNFEEPLPQSDGGQLWLRTNKVPLHDRNGNVIGILGTYEDITAQRQAEEELKKANAKLTMWVSDLEKRNQEATLLRQMDGLLQVCTTSEEAYAVIRQFGPLLFPDTCGALYAIDNSRRGVETDAVWGSALASEPFFEPNACWALRRGQIHLVNTKSAGLHCRHVPKSFTGSYLDVPMMASGEALGLLHIEDQVENVGGQGAQNLASSVAEHLALALSNINLRETLRSQSIRDVLTGLFNRRYMEESLDREIHRAVRRQSPVGIVMLDIDHFKVFNDTYGHDAGDVVLHELGRMLKNNVRGEDIACRFGGEEFILILPDASLEMTQQRAEQICEAIKGMALEYRHQPLGLVTVSVGVACFPSHGTTSAEIIQKADAALYQAKHRGRDRVEVASIL